MAERDQQDGAAKRHVAIMKTVFANETRDAIGKASIIEAGYAPAVPEPESAEPTKVSFSSGNIVGSILRASRPVAVLADASYRYAGGGYMRGWSGVEEDLCRESNLYPILESFQKSYYGQNRQTTSGELYTSRAISIPDVVFSRNGEIVPCSVCIMAAPNRARALQRNRSARECDLALAQRIEAAMQVLADFGAQTVIIPAFGCGRSGNDATQAARLFLAWLEAHDGLIPEIEFSIWNGGDAAAFKAVFADRLHEEEPEQEDVPVEEDDDSEEDWERYRISE